MGFRLIFLLLLLFLTFLDTSSKGCLDANNPKCVARSGNTRSYDT